MPPPRGGGALLRNLSDKNGLSSASLSGQNATENLTPEEQAKAELDSNILAGGGLGLDPENDPVIYTTDYGLEIKSHNAAGLADVTVNDPSGNGTITVSSTTWNYMSAGGYNWIIIGQYSSSSYTISNIRGDEYSRNNPDGTDAGNEVESANANGLLQTNFTIPAFTNAVVPSNGEIPAGCVLCLLSGTTGTNSTFSTSNSYYPESILATAIRSIYDNIKYELGNAIQETQLITYGYDINTSTLTTYEHSEYLFPLATSCWNNNAQQSFRVETYLDTKAKYIIGTAWWLRSGCRAADIADMVMASKPTANLQPCQNYKTVTQSFGVRPAFVLRLYS